MDSPLLSEAEEGMLVATGSPKDTVEDGVGKPPYGSKVEEEEPLFSAVVVTEPVPVGPTKVVELAVTGYGILVGRADDDEAVTPPLSLVDELKTLVPVGSITTVELAVTGYGTLSDSVDDEISPDTLEEGAVVKGTLG